jgi:transcription initiation factor TFIIB
MTGSQHTVETTGDQQTEEASAETPITQHGGVTEVEDSDQAASITQRQRHDHTDTTENTDSESESPTCCENCDSENLSTAGSNTEVVCEDCGTVLDTNPFPETAGWKHESSEEHTSTVNVTGNQDAGISMNALGGRIDWKDMDGYGSSLSSKKRATMHRLRDLDQRLTTSRDETQNYKFALGEMNRMANLLSIPRYVQDAASEMYEELLEDDLSALAGMPIETVSTAVLYAACEDKDIDRSASELADISHIDQHELVDTYERLAPALGVNDYGINMNEYTAALCDELNVDDDVQENAMEILTDTLTEEFLQAGSLIEYIAAAVYTAAVRSGEVIPQEDIAGAAGISQNSLRARYQQQLEAVSM